jgi:hypothetical protein
VYKAISIFLLVHKEEEQPRNIVRNHLYVAASKGYDEALLSQNGIGDE